MIFVELTGAAAAERAARRLGRRLDGAVARALNRTIDMARTEARRQIQAEVALKTTYVNRNLLVTRARRDALEAALTARTKKPIPAIAFVRSARVGRRVQLPGGIRFTPVYASPPFVQRMRSGHVGIFRRVVPTASRRGQPRSAPALPIVELTGPPIPRLLTDRAIFRALRERARVVFRQRLAHELARLQQAPGEA